MKDLKEYAIQVGGLKIGVHEFQFTANWEFLSHFEDSPVKQALIDFDVRLDKQQDHWIVDFDVAGDIDTECDRCTAPIALGIEAGYTIIVKYDEEKADENQGHDEIVYVSRDMHRWDISNLLYEFILLSIPARKVYNCEEDENPPCDFSALEILEKKNDGDPDDGNNPFRDAFKNIELKK